MGRLLRLDQINIDEAALWLSIFLDRLHLHVNDSLLLGLEEVTRQQVRIIVIGLLRMKSNLMPHHSQYLKRVSWCSSHLELLVWRSFHPGTDSSDYTVYQTCEKFPITVPGEFDIAKSRPEFVLPGIKEDKGQFNT